MSTVSSPSAIKSAYSGTPQHLKTLDVLGRTKDFQKLGHLDLVAYCELARTKYYCKSYADVLVFLEDKYGWEVNQRETDLELAWEALVGESAEKSDSEEGTTKVAKGASSETSTNQSWADIPVVLKGNSARQTVLICQVDDENLQFAGDSGAVGRIFCDPQSLRLDLKGRQYSAQLTAGPTLMILNLAPPVGQSSTSSSKCGGLCARAEVITNEFCHLTFEKDLHGTLQGVYTGEDGENHEFNPDDASDSEVEHGPNKKKKVPSSGKKSKAAEDGGNPKISTITQRKRKSSSTGKKSASTKKSKSK